MVTMAATTLPPPKARLDPATLKFTAVKVDVSKLTKRCKCKAFVISSQTTSRDLADMVLRKLKIDVAGHVTGTCLLTESSEGKSIFMDPDDRVLSYHGTKSKKAQIFELVPADSVDPIMLLTSLRPSAQANGDAIKAGNLANPSKNGMTLPGYKKVDANCNLSEGDGFLTSTPNPECDSLASTVDSGFMIHYEPFNGVDTSKRVRSKSFELARDNGYGNRLDLSGNASDSGMIMNGNGHSVVDKWTSGHGLDDYPYRISPQDGFQVMQSKNSAWTPFSRFASDSVLKGLRHKVMPLTGSVPDVSDPNPDQGKKATVQRRRSLPRMSASQEEINEKKRNVADLFAVKLRLYMDKSRKSTNGGSNSEKRKPLLATVPHQYSRDDDDAVSVTSMEVAEIMSSASPLKPYEEDDITESDESLAGSPNVKQNETTPQNVFQPLPPDSKTIMNDSHSEKKTETLDDSHTSANSFDFQNSHDSNSKHFTQNQSCSSDNQEKIKSKTNDMSPSDPHKRQHTLHRTPVHIDRGVPLFVLLPTHSLAPVMVRRNMHSSTHFLGVRLCDVTYAKCVRHVIRHWENSCRQFTLDPKLAECLLVAVGGIDRRTTTIIAGKLFRGDIIAEVNGRSTLKMSAREVMDQMSKPEVVSLVVARSRLNVDRAQSP